MNREKSSDIKKIIQDYKKKKTKIEKKYKESKKETETMRQLKEMEVKIKTVILRIERLQEELSQVSPKDKDLIE